MTAIVPPVQVRLSLVEFPADDPERARQFWSGLLLILLLAFATSLLADDAPQPDYSQDALFRFAHEFVLHPQSKIGDFEKVNPKLLRLARSGKVVLLPHMGSATLEGRIDMGERVIVNIRTFLDGHKPPDRVLPGVRSDRRTPTGRDRSAASPS